MKRPTKKAFLEFMKEKYPDYNKTKEGKDDYLTLLDVIQRASKSDSVLMELADLTLMNKTDKLIYRNAMACAGVEMTPLQVEHYLSTIEYGLEYIT
jgi:hypothetical protein|tara:strand:+ start:835 stop:1122 length:288 start_codon:yes stop_codon:yes gene_type:complete